MRKRYAHIDLIEAIAILFVVIYHTRLYSSDIYNNTSGWVWLSYFFDTLLSTCVPLFFFANGYLLFSRKLDLRKHIFKIIRFIIITLIWSLIYMLFYYIRTGETYSLRSFVFGVLNMNIEHGLNVMWFMGAIVCIYILFPALKALFDANKKAFVFLLIVCTIFSFGIVLGQEVSDILTFSLNHRVSIVNHDAIKMFNPFKGIHGYSLVYFCIGGLAYVYEEKILKIELWKRNTISIIGLIVSCGMLFGLGWFYSWFNEKTWDVVFYGYDTIFTFFNVLFVYCLCLNYKKQYKIIYLISCNTLGIYFIHNLFIPFTQTWLQSFGIFNNVPCSIIYAIIILFVSLGISIILKKIPIIKKLQLT